MTNTKISNKGKILLMCLGLMLVCMTSFFGVRAYLSDSEEMVNVVSVGQNDVEISERFDPPTSLSEGVNIYEKTVALQNQGDTDAYVRVLVQFSESFIADRSGIEMPGSEGTYYSAASGKGETTNYSVAGINPDSYLNHLPQGWVYVDWDEADNIRYTDESYDVTMTRGQFLGGYFYYTKPLKPGETTQTLIKSIKTYFENENDVHHYDVHVLAESVQVKDHNGNDFDGWEKAWIENIARR